MSAGPFFGKSKRGKDLAQITSVLTLPFSSAAAADDDDY